MVIIAMARYPLTTFKWSTPHQVLISFSSLVLLIGENYMIILSGVLLFFLSNFSCFNYIFGAKITYSLMWSFNIMSVLISLMVFWKKRLPCTVEKLIFDITLKKIIFRKVYRFSNFLLVTYYFHSNFWSE